MGNTIGTSNSRTITRDLREFHAISRDLKPMCLQVDSEDITVVMVNLTEGYKDVYTVRSHEGNPVTFAMLRIIVRNLDQYARDTNGRGVPLFSIGDLDAIAFHNVTYLKSAGIVDMLEPKTIMTVALSAYIHVVGREVADVWMSGFLTGPDIPETEDGKMELLRILQYHLQKTQESQEQKDLVKTLDAHLNPPEMLSLVEILNRTLSEVPKEE